MKDTKVIVCIASRLESTRLPEKVLAEVQGKPMNQWLVERLKTCKNVDDIVLCTTDTQANDRLVEAASEWGIKAYKGSEKDVLKRFIDAGDTFGATHIIRVTGDNIFTDPAYLDRLIEAHLAHEAEYSRVNNLPLGMTGEVLNMDMAKRLHASIEDSEQTEYMVLYAYNPDRYKCLVLEAQPEHHRPYYAITIDTSEDLALVQKIMGAYAAEELGPNLNQIIAWLDAHKEERVELNDETPIRMPYGEMWTYKQFMNMMNERAEKANGKLKTA